MGEEVREWRALRPTTSGMLAVWCAAFVWACGGAGSAGGVDARAGLPETVGDGWRQSRDGVVGLDGPTASDSRGEEAGCGEGSCGPLCGACGGQRHCVGGQCLDICTGDQQPAFAGLWSVWMEASEDDRIAHVVVGGEGNAYVVVSFRGPLLTVEETSIDAPLPAGKKDFLVLGVGPEGEAKWLLHIGGYNDDEVTDAALGLDGNLLLVGATDSPILEVGECELEYEGHAGGFLARVGPDGACNLAVRVELSEWTFPMAVALSPDGRLLVAGVAGLEEDLPSGEGEEDVPVAFELFIAELDWEGKVMWATTYPGEGFLEIDSMTIDADGRIYLSGLMSEFGMDFGGGLLESAGKLDGFLAKYDQNGEHLWSVRHGGSHLEIVEKAVVDAHGNVCIAGSFKSPTLSTGSTTHTNVGQFDVFAACLDPDGEELWSDSFGDVGWDFLDGLETDAWGNLYLSGEMAVGATPGETSFEGFAPFLRKYDGSGNVDWHLSSQVTPWLLVFSGGLAALDNGNLYVGWGIENPYSGDGPQHELAMFALTQAKCKQKED